MDLIYSVLHAMRHLVSDVSLYCVGKVSYTQHMPCATLTESGGELLSCVCVCVCVCVCYRATVAGGWFC